MAIIITDANIQFYPVQKKNDILKNSFFKYDFIMNFTSPLRIAAITKCYQETTMLPIWIRHYARLVGKDNLFILDDGSDPPVKAEQYIYVEHIPRRKYLDEQDSVNIMSEWQHKLLKLYDWVLCIDTDEFIIPRPSRWTSLHEYLAQCSAKTCRCVGVEIIDPLIGKPVDWSRPILKQRSKGTIKSWSCKPSVSSVPTQWEPGFHRCQNETLFAHDLWLFHLKYADQNHLLERSKLRRRIPRNPEDIKNGLGTSHLISDNVLIRFLKSQRSKIGTGTLDDYLITNPDPDNADSLYLDIPHEFIDFL